MYVVLFRRLQCADTFPATMLYFGCRSAQKDHHYASEWHSLKDEQKIHYRVAFSRDGPEGEKRTYVQDLLKADAHEVWNLVGKQQGWVLISGSASLFMRFCLCSVVFYRSANKMPAGVRESLAFAAETQGGMSEESAKRFVHDMTKEGRLIEECWS